MGKTLYRSYLSIELIVSKFNKVCGIHIQHTRFVIRYYSDLVSGCLYLISPLLCGHIYYTFMITSYGPTPCMYVCMS